MSEYWDDFNQSYSLRTNNAPEAIRVMSLARDRAAMAGDAGAVLYMNHWILQTLIFRTQDFKTAYDLAVKAAIEARKPQYAHMQEHICSQQDLILTYLGIDPEGYADLIDDAIRFMAQEITSPIQCRFCLQELRCSFEVARGRLDDALTETHHYLAMSDGARNHKQHHQAIAISSLCEVAYRKGDWSLLLKSAEQGDKLSANEPHIAQNHCFFVACQALAQRHLGAEAAAQVAYRRAVALRANMPNTVMYYGYYDTLCLYHQAGNDFAAALALRDQQLAEVVDKGQLFWEAKIRLERLRLLKALNQPLAADAALVRPIIQRLKRGDHFMTELDNLLSA